MTQRLSEIFSKEGTLRKFLKDIDNDYETTMLTIFTKFKNFQGVPVPSMRKSDNRSNHSRRAGNDAFYEKCYSDALSLYNIAIMQAPPDSYALAQAYNNRSALFVKLNKPEECLKDIELCLKISYLGDIKKKLMDRKRDLKVLKPKESKSAQEDYEKYFRISGEVHKTIPCASNAVEIRDDRIFASRDIKTGEVLSAETAYVSCLKNPEMALCCHYCQKFAFNLIPCDHCCFTLFCDEECKKKSWEEVHKIECEVYKTGIINNCYFRLSLQAVLKALVMYGNDWNKLMTIVEESEKLHGYVDGPYDSVCYKNLCTQSVYEHMPRRGRLFECAMNASLIVHTLSRIPSLLPSNKKDKKKAMTFLGKQLMFHHENSAQLGISGGIIHKKRPCFITTLTILSEKAIGLFPFTRMYRHSCHSNAETFGLFRKKVVVAIRNIPKGIEITIPYWKHYSMKPVAERKRFLFMNFGFICKCDACRYDWVIRDTDDIPIEKLTGKKREIITIIGPVHDYRRDIQDQINNGSHNLQFEFIKEGLSNFSDCPKSVYYKLFLELFHLCYLTFHARLTKQFGVGAVDPNCLADS